MKQQSGANSVKVADALYEKIEEVKASIPSDIQLEIINDDSVQIRDTLKTLYSSAWQGIILAVIILFVFLKSFKSTFIISISIPFSIIITLLLMNIMGITLNIMTLTGLILGIGMVVDASVVMIDNIYSYRMRATKAKVSAILGTQEMISSVVSGNLTTIVVFVPFLLFMKDMGFIGLMAKDMIYTIVIAIVSSLFVAIFLVPVLAGHYMPLTNRAENPVRNKVLILLYGLFDKGFNAIAFVYKKVLNAALNHKARTVILSFAVLAASFALVPLLHIEMMPDTESQAVQMTITLPTGTSLAKTTEIVHQFEKIMVQGSNGLVSLANFASVKKNYGPTSINHENKARTIHIIAGISGNENAPDVEAKIKKAIRQNIVLPGDVSVSFEGSWKNMKKQAIVFAKVIVLAILLVFGVMAGMYGSFKKPFINLFTILFMFIGVLLIYFLSGQPIGLCVVGGLLSSTFITLVLIPVLYALMNKKESHAASERHAELVSASDSVLHRCEIIANQSVEDDIIEILENSIPDF